MAESDEEVALATMSLLVEALPLAAPPPELRARLYAELTGPARFAPFAQEIADTFKAPLPAVLAALAQIDDHAAWLGSPTGPGMLPVHGRTVISRLPAGTRIPAHTHEARELTYILDGTLISDGVEHGRASCLDMAAGTEHALRVSEQDSCLVVFAAFIPER